MSAKGSRRSAGISLTTAQRTAEIGAACYDELPQRDSSVAAEIDVNQPLEAIRAAEAENSTHRKATFRDFHSSPLPEASPARDGLSSLSYVSFSDEDIYKPRLLEQHFTEAQSLTLSTTEPPKPWHKAVAQRRATTAAEAPNERRLSGSRARARLCLLSPYSAERRRDWSVMRD